MYPPTGQLDLPKHEAAPEGMPPIAFTYECDGATQLRCINSSTPVPYPPASTAPPDNITRTLRKGYYAAVSWTDYLIGLLLDKLDELGHTNDTVVALIGE